MSPMFYWTACLVGIVILNLEFLLIVIPISLLIKVSPSIFELPLNVLSWLLLLIILITQARAHWQLYKFISDNRKTMFKHLIKPTDSPSAVLWMASQEYDSILWLINMCLNVKTIMFKKSKT